MKFLRIVKKLRGKGKQRLVAVLFAAGVLCALGLLYSLWRAVGYPFMGQAVALGMGETMAALGFCVAGLWVFLPALGAFAALPPGEGSRTAAACVRLYAKALGGTAFTALPLCVLYGVAEDAPLSFYILLGFLWLLLPLLPLGLAALVCLPLPVLAARRGVLYRRVLVSVFFVGLLALRLYLWYAGTDFYTPAGANTAMELLTGGRELLESFVRLCPPAVWAARVLARSGPAEKLWYFLGSAAGFCVLAWFCYYPHKGGKSQKP